MEIENKLTKQQWDLLNFLRENGKTSIYDLSQHLGYLINLESHDKCIELRNDADAINNSPETEKLVLRDNNNYYWLATDEEEAIAFAKSKYLYPSMNKLTKYWTIIDKIKKNGQGKLLSIKGDPIDEDSRARRIVETYLKDNKK